MERGREGGWNKVMSAGVDICRWLDVLWCCDVREWSRATATATFTTRQLDWSQSWPERIDLVARQFGLDCNFTVRMLYRNMYWLLYILDLRFVLFLCTTAVWQFAINEYVMLCYVMLRRVDWSYTRQRLDHTPHWLAPVKLGRLVLSRLLQCMWSHSVWFMYCCIGLVSRGTIIIWCCTDNFQNYRPSP